MRQRNRLLGDSLYKIADLLFADAQSLFALIADFQQEWTATTSRLGRGRLRLRFVAAFWQGVLLQSLYRATRPPNVRATLIVTGSALLAGLSVGGLILWTTGDSPHVIVQLFISIPMFVSWAISDSELSYIARVPERERWRTFHQFTVLWVGLATLWAVVTGVGAWLPIGTAASALASRGMAAWRQHRRDHRAVKG